MNHRTLFFYCSTALLSLIVAVTGHAMNLVTPLAHAGTTSDFLGVTVEPDHSMRSTGYPLRINMQAPANEWDMVVSGPCTVDGQNVSSTLENDTDGLYIVNYVVGANDPDAAEGDIPIDCVLSSPTTGDTFIADHWTTPNTTGIDPDFVTNDTAISDGPTSETITFNTAFPTSAYIEYTTNGVMQSNEPESDYSTSHSITITGLTPSTPYTFEIVATTADGIEGTSPETLTFTTPALGGGNESGGTGTATSTTSGDAPLSVTSIEPVTTSGIADNTFADGWKYIFNITVPSNETQLNMKFTDWTTPDDGVIPATNDIQISSAQASSSSPVTVTAANEYSVPLDLTSDDDPNTPGRQIQVIVEVRIPPNTQSGDYSTTYSVQSE